MVVPDLRFGAAPLLEAFPGYDPAGDARALAPLGFTSPATQAIPGERIRGSFGPSHRFVASVPTAWNGRLVVCGTPAMRSEHANDLILGDWLLAAGYAFASSNKGIPYNALAEPWREDHDPSRVYRVPFAFGEAPPGSTAIRFGALDPEPVPVGAWQDDLPALVRATAALVRVATGRAAAHTYAIGLSIGGGQVRSLLERAPELVDGGLEWASVYWHPERNILRTLPPFLRAMPAYVASGYRDAEAHAAIVAAGYPPDRLQDVPHARSLWDAHYSALPPFYADFTTFAFAHVLDPDAVPLDSLEARAAYVPSEAARRTIAAFAHTGRIQRPLIGIAGDADVFVTPQQNFAPYLAAVRAAHREANYWQYVVRGGTHVDGYAGLGWNLQPQLSFVWRAFEMLVEIVEGGTRPPGAGTVRVVSDPAHM